MKNSVPIKEDFSMFHSCVHTHSNFCDGADAPEAMVLEALQHGFVSLGFSSHGHSTLDPCAMSEEGEVLYREEVLRLRQVYGHQIDILLGQEHEALSPYAQYPYDYLIESLHWIFHQGEYLPIDWDCQRAQHNADTHFGGDYYAYCRAYYDACTAAYCHSPAQICGHLDLVSKFNEGGRLFDETDPRYLGPAKDALAAAVERGMVLELNTGAIARGYRTAPYPSIPLLHHLKDIGGQIIVTSDCHNKNYLTCFYDQAGSLLEHCGFTHTVVLTAEGFREEPLTKSIP